VGDQRIEAADERAGEAAAPEIGDPRHAEGAVDQREGIGPDNPAPGAALHMQRRQHRLPTDVLFENRVLVEIGCRAIHQLEDAIAIMPLHRLDLGAAEAAGGVVVDGHRCGPWMGRQIGRVSARFVSPAKTALLAGRS